MASAEDVGKRLHGEVEERGLDEILRELRLRSGEEGSLYFNFQPLHRLLQTLEGYRQQTSRDPVSQPIVELMSVAPGGGKTHLVYHLCAIAALSPNYGGKQKCVVVIDTDVRFSVQRLATQIQLLLRRHHSTESSEDMSDEILYTETVSALKHIHIFRPQSLATTIATLHALPDYLFHQNRHYSIDREVAFIALDSASAFQWQDRSENENAAFLAKTTMAAKSSQSSAYFQLATALKSATMTFNCPCVFTSWYLGPQQKHGDVATARSFPPQIPPLTATVRLIVQRLPVRKFPAGLSLDGALREAGERQKAVAEARFDCFVNEWGLDERLLQRLHGSNFGFRILIDGLLVEEVESEKTDQD